MPLCAMRRLISMQSQSTTMRVDRSTRDLIKSLAAADGIPMDEEVKRLARTERQRRMGAQQSAPLSDEDRVVIEAGIDTVRRHARW
jgi:hypothetical protein